MALVVMAIIVAWWLLETAMVQFVCRKPSPLAFGDADSTLIAKTDVQSAHIELMMPLGLVIEHAGHSLLQAEHLGVVAN
jgi:hypothetical protein